MKALFAAVVCTAAFSFSPLSCLGADTVFFVVRHAEKAADDGDPPLSAAGKKRAEQLMQTLRQLRIDAIYHTKTVRSEMTAQPLMTEAHVMPTKYADATKDWTTGLISSQKGKRTLIVAHSDTISQIVGWLTDKAIPEIGDHYDNLFVVVISDDGKSVVRLHYGDPN